MSARGYDWALRYARGRIAKMRHIYDEKEWTMPGRVTAALQEIERGNATKLLERAKTDADMFETMQHLCADFLERGAPIPSPLRDWAADAQRGEKAKRGVGRPGGKTGKHRAIWRLVETITKETDLNATRGEYSPPVSACDAIAEAFREARLRPNSFGGVRDAYQAEKRRIKQADQGVSVS